MVKKKTSKDQRKEEEALRLKPKRITLDNQTIIEFAYLTRDIIKPLIESHVKLCFEQANCYLSCFYRVCNLLKRVNADYLKHHVEVVKFFNNKQRLTASFTDRLYWENEVPPDLPYR